MGSGALGLMGNQLREILSNTETSGFSNCAGTNIYRAQEVYSMPAENGYFFIFIILFFKLFSFSEPFYQIVEKWCFNVFVKLQFAAHNVFIGCCLTSIFYFYYFKVSAFATRKFKVATV